LLAERTLTIGPPCRQAWRPDFRIEPAGGRL
jgi:hypothetical protein